MCLLSVRRCSPSRKQPFPSSSVAGHLPCVSRGGSYPCFSPHLSSSAVHLLGRELGLLLGRHVNGVAVRRSPVPAKVIFLVLHINHAHAAR